MGPGAIVFPSPQRYFDDMMHHCMQLSEYYQRIDTMANPAFVAKMKRAFLFENRNGDYGEFEAGDRFILFSGPLNCHNPDYLFASTFPTPEILMEVMWEGIPFRLGIVAFEAILQDIDSHKFEGIDFSSQYSENSWLAVEPFQDYAKRFNERVG